MTNPNTASVSETNITLGSKNQKGDRHGLRFHKLAHAGVSNNTLRLRVGTQLVSRVANAQRCHTGASYEPCDLGGQRCARRLDLLTDRFPRKRWVSCGLSESIRSRGAAAQHHENAIAGGSLHIRRDSVERHASFTFATERSHQRDAEPMHDGLRDATSDTVGTGSLGRILSAIVSTMGVALVGYGTFALLFGW